MAPAPPPRPVAPEGSWPEPPAPRGGARRPSLLGVPAWVVPTSLLPVAPLVLLALAVPEFVAPLGDVWPAFAAAFAVLVLANLVAGRARSEIVPAAAILFTTAVGLLLAVFSPAVVRIAENLG